MLTFEYDPSYEPLMPVATVTLIHPNQSNNLIEVTALVDSGADGTLLPIAILNQINAPLIGDGYMRGVLGTSEPVDICLVQMQIGPHYVGGIRAAGMPDGSEAIIVGRDVLNHFVVTLNGLASMVEITS